MNFFRQRQSLADFFKDLMDFSFFLQSLLLGAGLAMDAFSISIANGLAEPHMPWRRGAGLSLVFGFYQWLMPMIGWAVVFTALEAFQSFQFCIPWISFALLVYFGITLIKDAKNKERAEKHITFSVLMLQGLATSMDALSVGFVLADQSFKEAMTGSVIIGLVTFFICLIGVFLGKKVGWILAEKAKICGGILLILIGCKILYSALI